MHEDRSSDPIRPVAVGISDVGRQRELNEDHLLIQPKLSLFAVADGMGGHSAGDVASKLTAVSLCNFFEATLSDPGAVDLADSSDLAPEARRLIAGIRKANRDVFEISSTFAEHKGMGSTIVAVHVSHGNIHIAHVGDSRCYRIRDGEIKQMTRDHSLINDALELKPDLTPQELARLPKNVITRALGMASTVKVDVQSHPALHDDIYLLCSDGLTGMVNTTQILEVLDVTEDLKEACELLIAMANEAGGTDNISALLIRIEPVPVAPVSSREARISTVPVEIDSTIPDDVWSLLEQGREAVFADEPLQPELVAPIGYEVAHCHQCGHDLFAGNAFCTECGARVVD
jgi:PPM family protein phosphatase